MLLSIQRDNRSHICLPYLFYSNRVIVLNSLIFNDSYKYKFPCNVSFSIKQHYKYKYKLNKCCFNSSYFIFLRIYKFLSRIQNGIR